VAEFIARDFDNLADMLDVGHLLPMLLRDEGGGRLDVWELLGSHSSRFAMGR
jgi:hypothetical protein